jgi:hypothetical protein
MANFRVSSRLRKANLYAVLTMEMITMMKFLTYATKGLQKVFETMILYGLNEMMKSPQ